MKNVLVLSAGRRVSLVRGFMQAAQAQSDKDICVYAADLAPHLSSACQISGGKFQVPHVRDPGYPDAVFDICVAQNIGVVVPTIDTELAILAPLRDRFSQAGITILISDTSFVDICRDKRATARFFTDQGLPAPTLYDPKDLTFPVLVKPYDGSLSAGVYLIDTPDGITPQILENPKNIYCQYIDHATHQEFTVDMYYDRDSKLRCVVPRRRLEVRGGEVAKALSEKNEIVTTLFEHMGHVPGTRGCLTLQLFRHPDTHAQYFIEINARFGGGYPLSRLAGADFQQWIIQEYILDQPVDTYHDWADRTLMLRYDAEVIKFNYDPI